jgi:pyridoxal phosphate enzyme (YggS family)
VSGLTASAADIAGQLHAVRDRITEAARRAGRTPESVRLVAVSKTFDEAAVRAAAAAGQRDFGENRVQEGLDKIEATDGLELRWHLIGHLQSNKARKAARAFHWIESIDSLDVLTRVSAAALDAGVRPRVLIQVDLAGEATKHGAPEHEVAAIARAALDAPGVELSGLMLLPPFPDEAEDSRPWFRRLRELRDRLIESGCPAERLTELSMGMSHDYEVAIEEGATIVRIGTAIFGRRPPPSAA